MNIQLPQPTPDIPIRREVSELIRDLRSELTEEEIRLAAYLFACSAVDRGQELTGETFEQKILNHFLPDIDGAAGTDLTQTSFPTVSVEDAISSASKSK